MKAIIIEEDRFTDFTTALHLKKMEIGGPTDNTAERMGWDKQLWRAALDEAHRSYHYEFVRWAQSHGATCVRK
jgi:hypothetical protein